MQQGDSLGPLLFSLVLTSLFDRIPPTPGVFLSLWYLDDGTIIGSRPAILELLHHIETLGPSLASSSTKGSANSIGLLVTRVFQTSLQKFVDLLLVWICWALQFGALKISTALTLLQRLIGPYTSIHF